MLMTNKCVLIFTVEYSHPRGMFEGVNKMIMRKEVIVLDGL